MTRSRNEALRHVDPRVELVAFLDDDVEARPGWAGALRGAFAEPGVVAVAGRTCNGQPGEEKVRGPVGRLMPDGTLSEGFAGDPGRVLAVEHGIGANMAFRRQALGVLGGFRDDYPGTALREDTDIFLRVGALGGSIVFAPEAVVDHRAAPHVRGARFDTRYKYYARRNHVLLLARNRGIASRELRAYLTGEAVRSWSRDDLSPVRRAQRVGITMVGLGGGIAALPSRARLGPLPPERTGSMGRELRARLTATGSVDSHVP
jgi:GT2 family glycosyltransferase